MFDATLDLAKRHPIRTALAVAALVWLIAFSITEAVRWAHWHTFTRSAEQITAVASSGRGHTVALSFSVLGESHKVHVRVDDAEFSALQAFPAEDAFRYRGRWRERFVTTFIDMQTHSSFIENLAIQLRGVARRRQLNDDEYLELMVAAVQSIPYVPPEQGVRTPAEVVADGQGICTEKSLTLAALMVHEGYDTVMWSFRSQRHVALGVATSGPSYRDSGYAFIETTHPAFIGQVGRVYLSSGPIHNPPEQIHLGGDKRYEASAQVAYILRVLEDAARRSRRSSAYPAHAEIAVQHSEDFARRASDHVSATELVDFITHNVSDRPKVYSTLVSRSPMS